MITYFLSINNINIMHETRHNCPKSDPQRQQTDKGLKGAPV